MWSVFTNPVTHMDYHVFQAAAGKCLSKNLPRSPRGCEDRKSSIYGRGKRCDCKCKERDILTGHNCLESFIRTEMVAERVG